MVWNDCSADAVPQRCEPVCVCDVRAVALWRRIFKRSVVCAVFGAVSRKPVFIVDAAGKGSIAAKRMSREEVKISW